MPVSIQDLLPQEEEEVFDIDIEDSSPSLIVETEDGGVLIDFNPGETEADDVPFGDNLADYMDESDLSSLSSDLVGQFLADKNSRKDWEETYIKGLDQLGMKIEDRTSPWEGACGVTHPILSEAVVRFQSQAIIEIFPSSGPVKTRIVGKVTTEKEKQAHRIQDFMNYLVTEVMTEYRPETEKMLFSLPLSGSAFRKVYWDPNMGRPCSMFVPSEDLVVSYGASSLRTCDRITHVMKRSANDIRKLQVSGFYRDVELISGGHSESKIQEKYDDLTGESPSYDMDGRHTVLEMHVDVDLKGFEDTDDCCEPTGIALPYVVTIDLDSREILSIRRNWMEDDPNRMRREHFVHYEYVPGLGFYGFGLIHMIGGIARSATSILRQLVDSGTLSNLPGGLKSRGLRIRGDDTPISPGEFRDVDVPSGSIAENITFLPYKEPSSVLAKLLSGIVEEGRRFASLTDLNISDMNQQAPVGTTLALIERSMKVMTAIQARLHAAMKDEFKILEGIVRDHAPHEYPYDLEGDEVMKPQDFDDRVDIIPVSDPNASTMAQRIMQYQAALQLASSAPQLYDLPKLHRKMVDVLGIPDAEQIVPLKDEINPLDPVSENMNLILGKPVKAFMYQDHQAHIESHMTAMQEPRMAELLAMDPQAGAKQSALAAHVAEHLSFQYRSEIEQQLGVALPPPEETLPEDVEVELSRLVAQATSRLVEQSVAEAQQQEAMQQAEDPIVQMQMRELQIKEQEAASKAQEREARLQLDIAKAQSRDQIERERIQTNAMKAEDELEAQVFSDVLKASVEDKKIDAKQIQEGVKIGMEAVKGNRE